MIVGVVGAAGGVGTTTVGLLLSAAIAEHGPGGPGGPDGPGIAETVFIEADRAGGVAGARFELGVHGGLRSWVAGLATDPALDVSRFGKLGAAAVAAAGASASGCGILCSGSAEPAH